MKLRYVNEFRKEHDDHELHKKGEKFADTVSWTNILPNKYDKIAEKYWKKGIMVVWITCPKCNIGELIIDTGKICDEHKYTGHIKIICTKCKVEGTTKNIDYIGARTLFIKCNCDKPNIVHKCGGKLYKPYKQINS